MKFLHLNASMSIRRARRIKKSFRRRVRRSQNSRIHENTGNLSTVSDKLEALKNLIPADETDIAGEIKADKLFQETADYILLLRTQILVLQKLLGVYGSGDLALDHQDAV